MSNVILRLPVVKSRIGFARSTIYLRISQGIDIPQADFIGWLESEMLHGKWINASQEVQAIKKDIKEMLLESPISEAKEFGIHASEEFGFLKINGCESIELVQEWQYLFWSLANWFPNY